MSPKKKRHARKHTAKKTKRKVAKPRPKNATNAKHPHPADTFGPRPKLGLQATVGLVIPHDYTIQASHASLPPVLSTPRMIQMMEQASVMAVLNDLPPGTISVGTRIEVDHLKAVPEGATVYASAKLAAYQGRFLIFDVEARSGEHVIGRGKVFRAIVEPGLHGQKAKGRV
jgi:fluoroacetyl-CoA thioesterase